MVNLFMGFHNTKSLRTPALVHCRVHLLC